jgi:hypothetical protein
MESKGRIVTLQQLADALDAIEAEIHEARGWFHVPDLLSIHSERTVTMLSARGRDRLSELRLQVHLELLNKRTARG